MKREMVQIRITAKGKHFLSEGYVREGQVLWAERKNAEQYINRLKIAEPVGASIGPSETKPAEPSKKKVAAVEGTAGRLTDSQKSSGVGPITSSSASPLAPASTLDSVNSSAAPKKRGRPKLSR